MVILALMGLAYRVLWRILKPVFDVVRYLGDCQMRHFVHEQLKKKVGEFPHSETDRIIVAAHSLGSLVAVDSILSHPDVWSGFGRIDLVTGGSPLHRLLWRFFPMRTLEPASSRSSSRAPIPSSFGPTSTG